MGVENLSPWDALSWFDTPTTTDFTVGATVVQIAQPNQRRVVLVVWISNSVTPTVGPFPGLTGANGHQLNASQGPLVITQAQYGALCQGPWFALATLASGTLSVTEVLLRDWPRPVGDVNGPAAQVDARAVYRNGRLVKYPARRP